MVCTVLEVTQIICGGVTAGNDFGIYAYLILTFDFLTFRQLRSDL